MNILFVWDKPNVGGVVTVTEFLANKFVEKSHNVSVLFLWGKSEFSMVEFDKKVDVIYGEEKKISKYNIGLVSRIITEKSIDVIINQMGGNVYFAYTLYKASKNTHAKIVAIYHNAPNYNTRLHKATLELEKQTKPFQILLAKIKHFIIKKATSATMRYSYHHSDYFVLLSKKFIPAFQSFTGISYPEKLFVINNPTTIRENDCHIDRVKEKIMLYVGRLEESQKRFSRILEVWKEIEPKLSEWRLLVVGDGPDRMIYEKYVNDNALKNISFEGYQQPISYYQTASILLLTSDYEGWGLILCESMRFGCVPVILGSYDSCYDIVDNNHNGIILPVPFNIKEWNDTIIKLVNSPKLLQQMSRMAINDSARFNINSIYNQWISFFNEIL